MLRLDSTGVGDNEASVVAKQGLELRELSLNYTRVSLSSLITLAAQHVTLEAISAEVSTTLCRPPPENEWLAFQNALFLTLVFLGVSCPTLHKLKLSGRFSYRNCKQLGLQSFHPGELLEGIWKESHSLATAGVEASLLTCGLPSSETVLPLLEYLDVTPSEFIDSSLHKVRTTFGLNGNTCLPVRK